MTSHLEDIEVVEVEEEDIEAVILTAVVIVTEIVIVMHVIGVAVDPEVPVVAEAVPVPVPVPALVLVLAPDRDGLLNEVDADLDIHTAQVEAVPGAAAILALQVAVQLLKREGGGAQVSVAQEVAPGVTIVHEEAGNTHLLHAEADALHHLQDIHAIVVTLHDPKSRKIPNTT